MNKQIMAILDRQEEKDQAAWRSQALFRAMIRQEFVDSENMIRLFADFDVQSGISAQACGFPAVIRNSGIPVRTGNIFAIHKHTLCQIPYWHTHDFYELIYVLRGKCTQQLNHWPTPLILQEKQACLLDPGTAHCLSRCSAEDVILKFTIPTALFPKIPFPMAETGAKSKVCVFNAHSPLIDVLVYTLLKESVCQRPLWDAAVQSYLSALLVELAREPEPCHSVLLHRLAEYLDRCIKEATLSGFADFVGYSPHYAAYLLKEQTGKSFQELMVSFKMGQARKMLVGSDAPVAEIAHILGYHNASGLYKRFLAAYGMTPAAYRNLFAAEHSTIRK